MRARRLTVASVTLLFCLTSVAFAAHPAPHPAPEHEVVSTRLENGLTITVVRHDSEETQLALLLPPPGSFAEHSRATYDALLVRALEDTLRARIGEGIHLSVEDNEVRLHTDGALRDVLGPLASLRSGENLDFHALVTFQDGLVEASGVSKGNWAARQAQTAELAPITEAAAGGGDPLAGAEIDSKAMRAAARTWLSASHASVLLRSPGSATRALRHVEKAFRDWEKADSEARWLRNAEGRTIRLSDLNFGIISVRVPIPALDMGRLQDALPPLFGTQLGGVYLDSMTDVTRCTTWLRANAPVPNGASSKRILEIRDLLVAALDGDTSALESLREIYPPENVLPS